jgi:hypothetical protein
MQEASYRMKLILGLVSLVAVLSMLVPGYVLGQGDFRIFVTDDDAIHELDLMGTEGQNGQVNRVRGFAIEANSVVQINQNENLQVFTSTNEPDRIEKVKVTDHNGQLIELTKVGNEWSVQGFDDGVYLLDVIVNMPNGQTGAFETVLVILAPNAQDANPTQVINQVIKVETQTKTKEIIFKDKPKPKPNPRPIGNPYCDLVRDGYKGSCHDRKDYDEETGLYPCRDGSNVKDWRDCKDAGKHPDEKKQPKPEPVRICTAGMDAGSLACSEGITVEQYCAKNPQTQGCPRATPVPPGELFCESPNNPPGCRPLEITPVTDPCAVPSSIECKEAMAEVERRAIALGIPTPEPTPTPEAGCQPEDDFCEPGCESPTMDCIDDVNLGDDGEDSVPDEEEDDESDEESGDDSGGGGDEGGGDEGGGDEGGGDEGGLFG